MKSFRVKNFRSFKDSGEINIKPITIFVGKNSCGKSTLLRFPAMIAQTIVGHSVHGIILHGDSVDFGSSEDVSFQRNGEDIEIELDYDVDFQLLNDKTRFYTVSKSELDKNRDNHRCKVSAILSKKKNRYELTSSQLFIDNDLICKWIIMNDDIVQWKLFRKMIKGELVPFNAEYTAFLHEVTCFIPHIDPKREVGTILRRHINLGVPQPHSEYDYDELEEDLIHEALSIVKTIKKNSLIAYGIGGKESLNLEYLRLLMGDEINEKLLNKELIFELYEYADNYNFISNLIRLIDGLMRFESGQTSYIGPFRNNPERVYREKEEFIEEVGSFGENAASLLFNNYHEDKELLNKVSKWLERIVGSSLHIHDIGNGYYQIQLVDKFGVNSNIVDVGYGVCQILPILIELVRSSYDPVNSSVGIGTPLFLIEQPELHLHPAAQAEIADLFVDCALIKNEFIQNCYLIETHSEHFIRKLQVMVADQKCPFTNDMIAIYYVDKDENGVSHVKQMELSPSGKFYEKWPSGFFDKSYELSLALLRANSPKDN